MRFKKYEPAERMFSEPSSIQKGCRTCLWLDNVDMHMYAKVDHNTPCCSRVMSILLTMDRWTYIVIIVQTQWSCNITVQTQGSCKTHIVIKVQAQGSCNIVQTQGSCNYNLTSKPRVVQYSSDQLVVQF